VLTGAHSVAGEWGHNPLPSPGLHELEHAPPCYCGKRGCIETWCSGPGVSERHYKRTHKRLTVPEIVAQARSGHEAAQLTLENLYDRLARSIATVVNILDPDVIVMGGGLSNIDELYEELPSFVGRYAFTIEEPAKIVKAMHGDSSGVRGAAWLWGKDEVAGAMPR
jgi:predicted NBD/HSP70 family sugar kinase